MAAQNRAAENRARLLDAAERWERDADAEEARLGVLADCGCGRAQVLRRVAAGFRRLAEGVRAA